MIRTGIGIDAHRFAPGRTLVLGGVAIEHTEGLLGHSDADVLIHALMDALLGAVADGDIGKHFPDTDPRYKDASSVELLSQVVARLSGQGWAIENVDVTVMAEAPRLAPHIDRMRGVVAEAMTVDVGRVSIKATTVEQMGALGRGEGMAAMAVATVRSASDAPA